MAAHSLAGGAVETAQKVIGTFPFLNRPLRYSMTTDINCLITEIVSGTRSIRSALEAVAVPKPESKVQIVVAPRGWVFVGFCHKDESDLVISRANIIRRWGTKKGLGELVNGPKAETILDPAGTVRVPLCAVLARIDCEEAMWNTKI